MTQSRYTARPDHGCAWVTGASSGIGRKLALALAAEGWSVAATARSLADLLALCEDAANLPGTITAFPGDVSDDAAMQVCVEEITEKLGAIALCVANAGIYLPQDGLAGNLADWHRTIDVNLKGSVNTILPVITQMKVAGRGQIAIVSSVAGYRGLPTSAAYGATKAGLINMAEALKFDLDRAGIRIQVINPGFVDTPATASNPFPMPQLISPDEAVAAILSGLKDERRFEIAFPKAFVRKLKVLRLLPYGLYFRLVGRATGWDRKPV